jgi:hypothetical protein
MRKLPFLLFIITPLTLCAQLIIPKGYFSSPLHTELLVTGSFGEVRPDHFHSGTDFRTLGREGLAVYAIADGYVSRIKVQSAGYGNALYIDHPNGFTSVYGHLQRYNDQIRQYENRQQYKAQSFEVDLYPPRQKDTIWVKRGDVIAYSGNSGASFGPHLHFEIRDTKTERIINPALFGLPVSDYYPPVITYFKIYPQDKNSFVDSVSYDRSFPVYQPESGGFSLEDTDTLRLWGKFSFGVEAFDYGYNLSDRNGYYRVDLWADSMLLFTQSVDSFAFSETRYINACVDYPAYIEDGRRILLSKRKSNNRMSLFNPQFNNGVADFSDGRFHKLTYLISDNFDHQALFQIPVLSKKPDHPVSPTLVPEASNTTPMGPFQNNTFSNDEVKVEVPAYCLYDSIQFTLISYQGTRNDFSRRFELHTSRIPLQSNFKVSVKADSLPQKLRNKALLVRIDDSGRRHPAGGKYEQGFVTAYVPSFGVYCIGIDTIAPVIKPSPLNKPKKRHYPRELKFKVTDNFSGISKYRATVNGNWILLQYDEKNNLMLYRFDEVSQPGPNKFLLVVEDTKGNKTTYSTTFIKK